jgi:tetratricopeptide (TPR) repeat protein
MISRGTCALGLLLAWCACASAQDAAAAEAAFARGEQHFAQSQFEAAESEFRSAYDLMAGHPNQPMILVNVARAIEQQNAGRESEALGLYEQALAATEGNAAAGDARRIAQERSAALRAQGVSTGGVSPIGFIVLGGGAAVAIAGAIVGGLALAQRGSILSECVEGRCPPELEGSAAEIDTLALVSDVLLFGGLAIAATGLILAFVLPADGGMQAGMSCGPTGCYAMLELDL